MTLAEAKRQVLSLIEDDIAKSKIGVFVDVKSPDRDPGKFLLDGKSARVIAPFNGFNVNIAMSWFDGSSEMPKINGGNFYRRQYSERG